jgi:hypothetical protein
MSRTDIFCRLPTDIVEYIFEYLTLSEFHNIGWVMLGAQNYKKYWEKSQLMNWTNVYIVSTNLLKGPAILQGMYNQTLLNFIYRYYWKSNVNIKSHDGSHVISESGPHLVYANPFMYDTIMCLLKFMPYKKNRFQKFLDCRQKICDCIQSVNRPIVYSWHQTRIRISDDVQNLLICSNSRIVDLELKIQHIVDNVSSIADGVPIQTFSWESYNILPQLLIPMVGNIEEGINAEFNNSFANDMSKYKVIITHFYPFIYDSVIKESIEHTLSLCKTTEYNVGLTIDNSNLRLLISTISNLGKTRLEILLENIPHKYALLTFGNKHTVNEMGIILTVSIIKSKLLSTFHNNILIKICKTYFKLWFSNIHNYTNEDRESILKSLANISSINVFEWSPNNYYQLAIISNNDGMIKYIVDNIPQVTNEHCRIAADNNISDETYNYINTKRTHNSDNVILIIFVIMIVICISILKVRKRRMDNIRPIKIRY